LAKAYLWFHASAEQGYGPAQEALGLSYLHGQGTAIDEAEAAFWMRKAAEQGLSSAQHNLAVLYATGRGVRKSLEDAHRWEAMSHGGQTV
jgi:uncharacterized protein